MSEKLKELISSLLTSPKSGYESILEKSVLLFFDFNTEIIERKRLICDLSSKELTKLLNLLEDKNNFKIRKLSLLILTLLVSNLKFKVSLLQKCGLSFINGRIFLSRLKYLYKFFENEKKCISFLNKVKNYKSKFDDDDHLFWFIPIENYMLNDFLEIVYFNSRQIFRKNDFIIDFNNIPDPNCCLCGFSIIENEIHKKKINKSIREKKIRNKTKNQENKSISISLRDKMKMEENHSPQDTRVLTSKSITRRIKDFTNKNKLIMNKKLEKNESKNTDVFYKNYISIRSKNRVKTPTINTSIYHNITFSPIRSSVRKINKNNEPILPTFKQAPKKSSFNNNT